MKKYSAYHLFFGCFIILIGLLFLSIWANINSQRKELIETAISEKLYLAETINEVIFSSVLGYRELTVPVPGIEKVLLNELVKFRDVAFLRVVGAKGDIILSTKEEELGKTIEDPDITKALATAKPIIKEEEYLGEKLKLIIYPGYEDRTIWIGFTLETINLLVQKTMIRSLETGVGALFFVAFFLLLLLRVVIVPIKKMTLACEEIRGGNLDVEIEVKSKMEIGALATTFNEMVKDLRTSQAALKEAKTTLEIKVAARTKELKELNENLEGQVEMRIKEIREKMADLERFQRVAVGREMKMIELKKETERLNRELKKYKSQRG